MRSLYTKEFAAEDWVRVIFKKKTLSAKQAASKKVGAELKFGPNRMGLSYRRIKNRRVNKTRSPSILQFGPT